MKRKLRQSLCAALLVLALFAAAFAQAESGNGSNAGPDIVEKTDAPGEMEVEAVADSSVPEQNGPLWDLSPSGAGAPATAQGDDEPEEPEEPEAPEEPEEEEPELPSRVVLGVKEQYAIELGTTTPESMIYKSTKAKVASVSKDGVITGKSAGKAKIRCYKEKNWLGTITVKVLPAPKKVSFETEAIAVGVKESVQLTPCIDKGARAVYTWSVKDESIVKVSQDGIITGGKVGQTVVTVKTQNGKKTRLTVSVAKAPKKVTLAKNELRVKKGETLQLKATLPKNAASYHIAWRSANEKIAKVGPDGVLIGVSRGSVEITAETFNGKKATCTVAVLRASQENDPSVTYRALLIGQVSFYPPCERNRGDVLLLTKMLRSVRGLCGGTWQVTQGFDLDRAAVLREIKRAFGKADDNDVSLFFIATHGDADPETPESEAGALAMISQELELLRIQDLANALKKIPGKVIVILQSCGSGAAIYPGGSDEGSLPEQPAAAKAFARKAVETFMKADPGILVETAPDMPDSDGVRSNTGELRVENKFYVLTASDYQELSWGVEGDTSRYNLFTQWLADGVGTSGAMRADVDKNGLVTLNEIFKYISKNGDHYAVRSEDGEIYYQHVQVYPANSDFVLFTR